MKHTARPATAAEITEIVGPLDDAVLIRIIETEATPAEVLEAFTWATDDDQIGTELEHRNPTSAGKLAWPASIPWSFPDRVQIAECIPSFVRKVFLFGATVSLFAKLGNFAGKSLIRVNACCTIRQSGTAISGIRCIVGRREFGGAVADGALDPAHGSGSRPARGRGGGYGSIVMRS